MGTTAALVSVSFICTVISFIPFPWHWRSHNIPTMMMMVWIGQGNFFRGISAILWSGSVERKDLVFCDIMLQLQIASVWGMCACALCITRHLESVSSPRYSATGLNDPRNKRRFDIFMCCIAPFIFAGIHLIVQGHRFDLVENIGCSYTTYWSWASLFLFYLPPVALSVGNSIYAGMALWWFIQRRAQFRDLLNTSGLSGSRYIRLMGLSVAELLGNLIINGYILGENAKYPMRPWINWQNVHSDFKRVDQYPLALYTQSELNTLWGTWALYPISAVLFFAFFGFGQEAVIEYKRSYQWVRVHVFRLPEPQRNHSTAGGASLPSFVVNSSMASRSKATMTSSVGDRTTPSMTASEKYDAGLDLDDDSLYDADEYRGRRAVALGDLESGTNDEKSFGGSFSSFSHHQPATDATIPPVPPMPSRPAAAAVRVSLSHSRRSSSDGSITETPSAL